MSEKILGYILLLVGLVVTVVPVVSVYRVFKGVEAPYKLFSFEALNLDLGGLIPRDLPPEQMAMIESQGVETTTELLPSNVLNDPMNLFAHVVLMGFISSLGFKLAQLGTLLVRPIKVRLNTEEAKP